MTTLNRGRLDQPLPRVEAGMRMTFECPCPTCAHPNHVEWARIGRSLFCGGCGRSFVVPAPLETASKPERAVETIRFRCPACGKKYATHRRLIGQKIRCKGCGGGVRVPQEDLSITERADPSGSSRTHRSSEKSSDQRKRDQPERFMDDDSSEVALPTTWEPLPEPPKKPYPIAGRKRDEPERFIDDDSSEIALPAIRKPSPDSPKTSFPKTDGQQLASKESDVDDSESDDARPIVDDVRKIRVKRPREKAEIVLPSRSEAMEEVRKKVSEEEAAAARKRLNASRRAEKSRKRRQRFFDTKETLSLIGWVSAFVGALAFLAWGYPDFRFPLGGILCVIGFIVYLLGSASIRMLVAEEGQLKALIFRFFPPYQWWFVWTRWSDTKDFAIFFAAGLLIMAIGSTVLKMSPAGRRAEKSEADYQKMLKKNQDDISNPMLAPQVMPLNGPSIDDAE